ncbi:MAG: hypothetical protein H6701_05440 [Myxococcales bacterium]|nr:hypothetical protein [Myxococcales bacterium]
MSNQGTPKPAWARHRDFKLTCVACGKVGLRYGTRSHLCRTCFRDVPGRLKMYGGPALRALFTRVKPTQADLDAIVTHMVRGDLTGAARAVRLSPLELVTILLPGVANDDVETPPNP